MESEAYFLVPKHFSALEPCELCHFIQNHHSLPQIPNPCYTATPVVTNFSYWRIYARELDRSLELVNLNFFHSAHRPQLNNVALKLDLARFFSIFCGAPDCKMTSIHSHLASQRGEGICLLSLIRERFLCTKER